MFSKKYEYRPDNPGVQENIERIRQRMVANLAPSRPGTGGKVPGEQEIAVWGEPAPIALEWQNYDSADQNLNTAAGVRSQIAEDNLQAEHRQGILASLGKAVRNSLKWYTGPSERYWEALVSGLDHVVTSLKAHDAVLQIHGGAIRDAQKEYSYLAGQLQGAQAKMLAQPSSQCGGDAENAASARE